ncbi:MAG: phosphate acyltransferase PlsX [Cytophagales bacterium]|nr:phosphate acyltransferase PlsX [Cytophaga sp.]
MRIALDAMGGDYAPKAVVEGAILASDSLPADAEIILIGKEQLIREHMSQLEGNKSRIQIVHADEVITMAEHPTKAFSQKPNSSIAVGFHLLKHKEVDAFCSAGNTGAMLVGSMFSIKPIEGIIRPGIAGFMPQESGRFAVIMDVGANADCKPEMLAQFAVIGSLYTKYVFGIDEPKVGLMNLGEEEEKGTILTLAAHQLIKEINTINFVGNVEGRDLFSSKADIIVCDGYTGNIILKMGETFYDLASKRGYNDKFFDMFNYEEVGGSPILGVNGNVIIGHGISSPKAIKNMMHQAYQLVKADISEKIKNAYS